MGRALNNPGADTGESEDLDDETLENDSDDESGEESDELEGEEATEGDDGEESEEGEESEGEESEEEESEAGEGEDDGEIVELAEEDLDRKFKISGREGEVSVRHLIENQIDNHPKWLEKTQALAQERQETQRVGAEAKVIADSWAEIGITAKTDPFGYLWNEIESAVTGRVISIEDYQELKEVFGKLVEKGSWNPTAAAALAQQAITAHKATQAQAAQQMQHSQPNTQPAPGSADAEQAIVNFQRNTLKRFMTPAEEKLLHQAAFQLKVVQGKKLSHDELLKQAWAMVSKAPPASKGKPAAKQQPRRNDGTFTRGPGRKTTKTRFSDVLRKGGKAKPKSIRSDAGASDADEDETDLALAKKVYSGLKGGRI